MEHKELYIRNRLLGFFSLEVKRDQAKRDWPKGTGQKGPAKRDQDPKGTMAKRDHGQKGPRDKRDHGQKGPRDKRDQDTKGTMGFLKC